MERFENNVLKGISGPQRGEVTGGCGELHYIIHILH
jgi:hypothetical protein